MTFREVMACLDGSLYAEKILPYAHAIAAPAGAKLTLLRVVENEAELQAAENYLRERAGRWGAEVAVKIAKVGAADSIVGVLKQNPNAIPAITTHGRSALLEMLAGSVALSVIRSAGRPVLLYRPTGAAPERDKEIKISSVVAALDGSEFSERILPFAAEMADALGARFDLVQVLPAQGGKPLIPAELSRDCLESSYLHRLAEAARRKYGLEVNWEVLHGDAGEAICRYIQGRQNTMLAMTSRARAGLEEAVFGSVTSECVRRAGVPILVYWPAL